MALQRIEIDKNKPLNPGDVIELEYRCTGLVWITSAQVAIIEWQLANRADWSIISNSLPENNRITFEVLIKSKTPQDPKLQTASIGVTALMISAAIVAVGVIGWLTLDKVYQIAETPAGKIAVAGTGLALPVVAGIVLLGLLKR